MKKIFLSSILVASSWVLFAQDTTTRTNTMRDTTYNNTNQSMNTQTNTTRDTSYNNANQNMNTTNQQNQNTNQQNLNTNQRTTTNNNQSNTSTYNTTTTSNYSAYSVPDYVQMNVRTQYPNVTNLTWDKPTADWYHGYYVNNGRYTHVYYSTDPYYNTKYYPERIVGYTVALPVLETYVPDDVINRASDLYKQNLYDITALRTRDSQTVYQVRVQDNGELKSMWMDANGTAVTEYWRTQEQMNTTNVNTATSTESNAAMNDNSSMNNNMNANEKTKVKTKTSSGDMQKTKTINGKTRTKKSTSNTNGQY